MAETIESRLKALGVTLPSPGAPAANYVPTATSGRLLFVSGQVSRAQDGNVLAGKVGGGLTVEQGQEAARFCGISLLGAVKAGIGDLNKISRVVKLVGFVNSTPDFIEAHKVINGCSDFLTDVLGERGRHARSAISVASLPLGAAVEVEAIVEIA